MWRRYAYNHKKVCNRGRKKYETDSHREIAREEVKKNRKRGEREAVLPERSEIEAR